MVLSCVGLVRLTVLPVGVLVNDHVVLRASPSGSETDPVSVTPDPSATLRFAPGLTKGGVLELPEGALSEPPPPPQPCRIPASNKTEKILRYIEIKFRLLLFLEGWMQLSTNCSK